jgi:hypothetical protein
MDSTLIKIHFTSHKGRQKIIREGWAFGPPERTLFEPVSDDWPSPLICD